MIGGTDTRIAWKSNLGPYTDFSINLGAVTLLPCGKGGFGVSFDGDWGNYFWSWTVGETGEDIGIPSSGPYKIMVSSCDGRAMGESHSLSWQSPLSDCQDLWWIDNQDKSCSSAKRFCGSYMYQGLRTFSKKEECSLVVEIDDLVSLPDLSIKDFNYLGSSIAIEYCNYGKTRPNKAPKITMTNVSTGQSYTYVTSTLDPNTCLGKNTQGNPASRIGLTPGQYAQVKVEINRDGEISEAFLFNNVLTKYIGEKEVEL